LLYRKEFYVMWYSGIRQEYQGESVVVCSVNIDDSNTHLIRVFHAYPDQDARAEDMMLEWMEDDPYIQSSSQIEIEIIMNHSPLAAFATACSELKHSFQEQGKSVRVEIKIVKLYNTDPGEDDADENIEGLRELHAMGIYLSPLTGKDWTYLREILRDKAGLKKQERHYQLTLQKLRQILKPSNTIAIEAKLDMVDAKIEENEPATDVDNDASLT
jgi:hypothetical protein